MLPRRFTDPLGSKLPALEQNILKLRAMEMLLVIFYVEELKRDVLDTIQATDGMTSILQESKRPQERVPKGTKNPVDKALTALVADGAITDAEKQEIDELIAYRNVISHRVHNLLLDVSAERIAREMITYSSDRLPKYDYEAVERLQYYHKRLDDRTHHYIRMLNFNGLVFRSAEKTFLAEIKRLRGKISRLAKIRQTKIKALNAELSLEGADFQGEGGDPRHPVSKYDDGRLTKRGVEICYRLFDRGKSTMAVAHLTGLSLVAARKRHRMWTASGGVDRVKVDLATIPHRKFYVRYDD